MSYDYFSLTLKRVPTPHQALAAHLRGLPDGIVGQFSPQLGWANNEAAVLVRRPDSAPATGLAAPDLIANAKLERLTPTLRPSDDAAPKPGGIYVHRWFEVEAGAADEFVELSGQGWQRFEAQFDTNIFGLFRAEAAAPNGDVRMLLLTRYADHGVWEASRQPSTTAREAFGSRHELTTSTIARSSLLVPLG